MLKQGLFTDKFGKEHSIFIVEETKFYRIDICEVGAEFHTDIDAIQYSMIRRKNTFEYGNKEYYTIYKEFEDTINNIQSKAEKSSEWADGKFRQITKKERQDLGFVEEHVKENAIFSSYTAIYGSQSLVLFSQGEVYGVKLDPINFSEYEQITISAKEDKNIVTPYYPLSVLRTKYDLTHIDKQDCVVTEDVSLARTRLYEFMRDPSPVKGFDTETTGVDVDKDGADRLVGIILSKNGKDSTYFPFRHEEFTNLPMEFLDELMDVCKKEEMKLVAHNKKFDRKVMLKEGYDLLIRYDTMLLSFILNPVIEKGAHALKTLMFKLNGLKYLELDEVFTSEKLIDFSKLPIDIVKYYACPDAYNVVNLFYDLYAKLPKFQRELFEYECKLADLKADQEYFGMAVDTKKFADNYKNTNYVIDSLLECFRRLTHVDGNINSPAVLSDLMYNRMGCKILLRTKTGKASTSSIAIKKLAKIKAETPNNINNGLTDLFGKEVIKAKELAESKYPALVILEKYREYNKRKTAFYARFERTMRTGRIYFWINQNGAASGRQSSPMHQLPPELKAVMLSDGSKYDLWGPDFSQIELRMIAFLANETDLIKLCCDPENDIHRVIGSLISGKPMWDISKEERGDGKRRNFGVVYLISKFGLAGQVFGPGYTTEQADWCGEQLDAFYRRFKRIARYIRENGRFVKEKGYMMTDILKRVRNFKEILDPDTSSKRKASLIRQANNLPVQGTAADYLKIAEVNMYYYIRKKGWYSSTPGELPLVRPMLSIHDEILISADESIPKEEIVKMIKVCMEIPVEGAPPFFVQPAKMSNWEGHSDDSLAMPIKFRDKVIEDYDKTGQSIFKESKYSIIVPQDIRERINKETGKSYKELAKEYVDKVSFEYISGDYGTEISDNAKFNGMLAYIESGFKTIKDENYHHLLDDYRDSKIREYMNGLLAEYGTDYKVVSQHVRHDSLTHDLIDRFAEQMDMKSLTHLERIEQATKLYIDGVDRAVVFNTKVKKDVEADNEKFFEEAESLVNFNENGEVIYEDPEIEEDDYLSDYDDEAFIDYITEGKLHYVWEMADVITLDLEGLSMDEADVVLKEAWKFKDSNGFYEVKLLFNGTLLDAGFRVENIDKDIMEETINKFKKIQVL